MSCECHAKDAFSSEQGFKTILFGPCVWYMIHCSAYNIEKCCTNNKDVLKSKKQGFIRVLEALTLILYCKYCRDSFQYFYRNNPPAEINSLISWTYEMHNAVNRKLNRRSPPLALYESMYVTQFKEDAQWKVGKVSKMWYTCLWMCLYLNALNFSVAFDPSDARHIEVQQGTQKLLQNIQYIIPNDSRFENIFTHELHKVQSMTKHFWYRTEVFHFVYQLELQCSRQGASIFGSDCVQVQEYFESVFRANHKLKS